MVDGKGMSVYYYTKDVKDSGTSTCTGGCLDAWPPVLAAADTPAVDGVTGTVGTIATPDGKKQLTINGMPVYYYAKDLAAGDITGQGVGGVWYLVAPSGEMITARRRVLSAEAAPAAGGPAQSSSCLELDGGQNLLGVRVDHDRFLLIVQHEELALVRGEMPRQGGLAVVVIVGVAHGDLQQRVAGHVAELADDHLEFRGVQQVILGGLGLAFRQVGDPGHPLGDVAVEFLVVQDQEVWLAPEPGGVERDDVFGLQQGFELAVELFQEPDGVRDAAVGSAVQIRVPVKVRVGFLLGEGVEGGHGAVEEVQVRGWPPCLPALPGRRRRCPRVRAR